MDEIILAYPDDSFPLEDLQRIATFLSQSKCLIAGYTPSDVGLLDLVAVKYQQKFENITLTVLPDRNIVSCLANIAQHGVLGDMDTPTRIAASLMAYCQCMNIHIEPSIAYHELAPHNGNQSTLSELAWFRAADQSNPIAWTDIAMERSVSPPASEPKSVEPIDLAFPLHRWNRNYIAALKIAELELSDLKPVERMIQLLDWMTDEFLFAGPAAITAAIYFAPNEEKRGMFKKLRSPNRERALQGIKNEAWDITHLSDFVRKVSEGEEKQHRYIFATADKQLASIAPLLISMSDQNQSTLLMNRLIQIWSHDDAARVVDKFSESQLIVQVRESPPFNTESIDEFIGNAENKIKQLS